MPSETIRLTRAFADGRITEFMNRKEGDNRNPDLQGNPGSGHKIRLSQEHSQRAHFDEAVPIIRGFNHAPRHLPGSPDLARDPRPGRRRGPSVPHYYGY